MMTQVPVIQCRAGPSTLCPPAKNPLPQSHHEGKKSDKSQWRDVLLYPPISTSQTMTVIKRQGQCDKLSYPRGAKETGQLTRMCLL